MGRVDLRSGNVDRKFLFEPDYDANLAPRAKTGMVEGVGETSQAPLRFDGAQFYATVGNNVYRYVFAEPGSHIRYWSRAIRARLVARSAAEVVSFALFGNDGYGAFSDGAVRGFDAVSGRTLLAATPCDRTIDIRVGVSRNNVYVVRESHVLRTCSHLLERRTRPRTDRSLATLSSSPNRGVRIKLRQSLRGDGDVDYSPPRINNPSLSCGHLLRPSQAKARAQNQPMRLGRPPRAEQTRRLVGIKSFPSR